MWQWRASIGSRLLVAFGSVLALGAPAGAATSGPAMPWDGPLQTILNSLSGTVAHILITVAVITTGLVFAFTEHGAGARRLFGVAFRPVADAGVWRKHVKIVNASGSWVDLMDRQDQRSDFPGGIRKLDR